jgi:hypothetical protein
MSGGAIVWLLLGMLGGVGHAATLWQSASSPGRAIWNSPLARLAVAGLTLGAAAASHRLWPTASGWACGLIATGVLLCTRRPA